MPPEISIIIVTWNGRQYLDACLGAVAAQEEVTTEVILVDNASTDGTADHVRERFPWVRLVVLAENRGFAGGNNAGVREARGRLVALLNNDTVPDSGWLRALCGGIDERAGFALAASRIVYMHDPTVIDSAGDGMLRWGGAFKRHHGGPTEAAAESREVFGVCGAACLISKAVFNELGGFDEDFFFSHEDVDLSYRARLRGYRCRYVADAVVRHYGSATSGPASAFAVFHGQRNLEWLYLKNTPGPLLLRTLPGHLIYNAAAAVHFARSGGGEAFLRGKIAALAGLPYALRKRAAVQRERRVAARAIWDQLEPRWLDTKRREKRFDASRKGPPFAIQRSGGTTGAGTLEPAIGVVVVNYNSGGEIEKALRSVSAELEGADWEAIVVDNASSDDSAARAGTFGPRVRLIRNADNAGFGRGVNQGVSALQSASLILMMNPDCQLMPGALAVMRAELLRHRACVVVGPKILNPDGTLQGNARGDPDMLTGLFGRTGLLRRLLPRLRPSARNVVVEEAVRSGADSVVVDWLSGACLLVRRDAFDAVGGFDEGYFMYWEDADLCRRLRGHGYHVRYVPGATAVHRVGQSSRTARAASIRWFHASAYRYYTTHVAPAAWNPKRPLARILLAVRCWAAHRHVN